MGYSPITRNKWLLCRFGGIGDAVILTVVAREIKKQYPQAQIHFCVPEHQVCLFNNLSLFEKVIPTKRFSHQQIDCIPSEDGWIAIESIKPHYDIVIDYKFSIEGNGQYGNFAGKQGTFMLTQNSNYQNWIDLSLGWADIDPETVFDKRPVYKVEPEEEKWAKRAINALPNSKVIGLQLTASSLMRTFYAQEQLPRYIFEFDPDATIVAYANDLSWVVLTKFGPKRIGLEQDKALRQSAALISQMNYFISADSGFAHIAQAMGTSKQIIIYTTVPGWTRAKYFTKTKTVETAGRLSCSPCFLIHRYCPVNMRRAEEQLSDRERAVMQLSQQNLPIHQAAFQLNTTPEGLQAEFQAANGKLQGLANVVPDCIQSITPEMIMEKLREFYEEEKVLKVA